MNKKPLSLNVDWERILAPISKDRPAGEFLIYKGAYDDIREARREDNVNLDQGIWQAELKKPDWEKVEAICLNSLMFQSKDLQIAAWLLESWISLYGFEGVKFGLELMFRLSQDFWEEIFPFDDKDIETRVVPFDWIDEKLYAKLKLISIYENETDKKVEYNYIDWELASRNENGLRMGASTDQEKDDSDFHTHASYLDDCKRPDHGFFHEKQTFLEDSLINLNVLEQFLDEKCGKNSPSLRHFRDSLQSILRLVENIIKHRGEEKSLTVLSQNKIKGLNMEDCPEEKIGSSSRQVVMGAGPENISSREDAYRVLQEVTQYLEAIEPHSPTPYLLRRAVAWGGVSFAQLLDELVRDPSDVRIIYEFLGLPPPKEI